MRYFSKREKGDPSEIHQVFTGVNLQLWCCRFWQLKQWDCNDMAFPYWRIYWNKNAGGVVSYEQDSYELDENNLLIISPNTPFKAYIKNNHRLDNGIHINGKRIDEQDCEQELARNYLLHLFIHFNLGVPFDSIKPGIFQVPLTGEQKLKLGRITDYLKSEAANFSLQVNLQLHSIITEMLFHLDNKLWNMLRIDARILETIRYIDRNIKNNLTNDHLAQLIPMATNSFIRLFRNEMNTSPQLFIKKRKIAKACALFDHTEMGIEEIAFYLGFADRYHFSRVFKQTTGSSPARYRKGTVILS